VTAWEGNVTKMRQMAREIVRVTGKPVKLIKLTMREDVEEITP